MIDGGPAFPVLDEVNGKEVVGGFGMSLRDYFAAHAPKRPHEWFTPVMDTTEPKYPARPTPLHPDTERILNNWERDPCYDLFDNHGKPTDYGTNLAPIDYAAVFAWTVAIEDYHESIREWRERRTKAFFVQWPYAWADEQLKAREAK